MNTPRPEDPRPWTAAEIKVNREALGFSRVEFSRFFDVSESTVRNWETGNLFRFDAPQAQKLEALVDETRDLIDQGTRFYSKLPDPSEIPLVTWAKTSTYWQDEPEAAYPARWHRMISGKIRDQVTGVKVFTTTTNR